MKLLVKEVVSAKGLREFIRFPDRLYSGCEYYIPALHKHQFRTLSPGANPAFEYCEARYWLVYSGRKVVGRLAAIINHRYNEERKKRYLRLGWFDFVEDGEVVEKLLDAAENWAREREMEYIHGPLGFISFDASGILVEGFDELPTAWGRYNYPYYDPLIKAMGYSKDVDWVEHRIKVPDAKPEREIKLAQLIKKRYGLRNAPLEKKADIKKYIPQVFGLINDVYGHLYGFSTLNEKQVRQLACDFLPLVRPDYVSVVLNTEGEVVAFGLVMPSLSHALKKAQGKMFPFGWMHVRNALKTNDTVDMLLIGVHPGYRNKGAHALIFEKILETLYSDGIGYVETTRELEDNERIQQLWAGYDKRLHKRARSYIRKV